MNSAGAIIVLHVKAGLSMLASKRVVEKLLEQGDLALQFPSVADLEELRLGLAKTGVTSELVRVEADETRAERNLSLHMAEHR